MTTKHLCRPFAVKSIDDSGTFSGYASVFDVTDLGGDVVEKGAFKATLDAWKAKGKLPKLLWQHNSTEPIGLWTKMEEDDHGLYSEGRILIDAGPTERRAHAHLAAGSVDGLSIGYEIPPGGGEWDPKSKTYRLKQLDLWETSVVTFPMNTSATVDAVKSALANPKEMERILRDAGLSRSQAKGLMSRGYQAIASQRDVETDEAEAEALAESIETLTKMFKAA